MSGIKEQVISFIEKMPNNITLENVIAELYFRIKVDSGLKELVSDKSIPHSEVKERLSKWNG